ncbi:MAG: helix-turn-helix transcriptional regulator, partial [Terracidiphilus sp.]
MPKFRLPLEQPLGSLLRRQKYGRAAQEQAIDSGLVSGFSILETTGLPSGPVYPAMRRLEGDGLIGSRWERQSIADAEQRPPRKYYKLTAAGA